MKRSLVFLVCTLILVGVMGVSVSLSSAGRAPNQDWPPETPDEPIEVSRALTPPALALPWHSGDTWQANAGHADNPSSGGRRNNVDFGRLDSAPGTVLAAMAGKVTRMDCDGNHDANGLLVDIENSSHTWKVRYRHLSSVSATDGATLAKGKSFGKTGTTCGSATPGFNHTHFGLWYKNSSGGWSRYELNGVIFEGYRLVADDPGDATGCGNPCHDSGNNQYDGSWQTKKNGKWKTFCHTTYSTANCNLKS